MGPQVPRVPRRRVGPLLLRGTGLPRGPGAGFTSWSSRQELEGQMRLPLPLPSLHNLTLGGAVVFWASEPVLRRKDQGKGVAQFTLLRRLVSAETVWRSGVVSGVPGGTKASEEKQGFLFWVPARGREPRRE